MVRVDHVMALARLFWIPEGKDGTHGTYVRYELEELLGILALESRRQQCVVIGEDLGTGTARAIANGYGRARILGCCLTMFERREHGGFRDPQHYPASDDCGVHDPRPCLLG